MTISEAFEAYEIDELVSEGRSQSTVENYRKARNILLETTGGDIPIELLMHSHIIKLKKHMHDKGNMLSYIAQVLRHIRIVLTYLSKHGYKVMAADEIKLPRVKYRETAWLTKEEIARFLSVIDNPRDKALFACLFSSGARYSELISLDMGDIVDGKAKIRGKGKKKGIDAPQELIFDAKALSVLNTYLKARTCDCEPLFVSRQHRRLSICQAENIAKKWAAVADIDKRITTHVFRHSFGTDLSLNGLDIYGISKQLRHANIETTRIYIHGADLRRQPDYDKFHTVTPV